MSPSTKRNKNRPLTDQHNGESGKESANRHVYVEPGVQIDLVKDLKEKYETNLTETNTQAQKQLSWAKVSAALLAVYVMATLGIYWANKKAADAAKVSADVAHDTLLVANRPWVSAEVFVDGPLQFTQNGATIALKVRLQNIGHSVAKSVDAWPRLTFDRIKALDSLQEVCNIANAPVNAKSDFGFLLFPDQPAIAVPTPVSATLQDIQIGQKESSNGDVHPFVLICVDYQSTLEERHHQTGLIRMLVQPRPEINATIGAFTAVGEYSGLQTMPARRGDFAN